MLSGKNGIMSATNSNAKEYKPSEQTITFANVAGEDEAKESLAELVDFYIIQKSTMKSELSFQKVHY